MCGKICSTVPQNGTQHILRKYGSSGTINPENGSHYHNHQHSHTHHREDRVHLWPSATNTNRSPHNMNSSDLNVTQRPNGGPFLSMKNNTRRMMQDRNYRQNFNVDIQLDGDTFRVIHDIFSGNTTRKVYPDDSPMIYPDDVQLTPKIISRNCTFGLCDEVENYPVDKIRRLISRSPELRQYFQQTEIPTRFNNRFGEDGDALCSTITHTKFPKSARNVQDVEMFLVNLGDYKQGIVYETCSKEGRSCDFSDTFPMGYTATCKQKFTVRRLMAVGMMRKREREKERKREREKERKKKERKREREKERKREREKERKRERENREKERKREREKERKREREKERKRGREKEGERDIERDIERER
ncbi:hypothetical protein JTB14_009828 [Gonioctena quinquepunctata]|nr:hypothetical protein JTB14_009828 [Gonioctena quinquepunctata]